MTLTTSSEIREVKGLDENERELIHSFMQGAVYCWVKNRQGEWFAVRDLVGGENTHWGGTPLDRLYQKHIEEGKMDDEAFDAAGKDIGWIVKRVLEEDSRMFEIDDSGFVNSYRWIQQ